MTSAYAYCERLAREHYENFPVASRLLPARMRPAIAAIYAFARKADDFADEPGREPEERLRLLDAWGRKLRSAHKGLTHTGTHVALPADAETGGSGLRGLTTGGSGLQGLTAEPAAGGSGLQGLTSEPATGGSGLQGLTAEPATGGSGLQGLTSEPATGGSGLYGLTADDDLIFVALSDAIQRHRLPVSLFDDLLSAFRQDVTTSRYESWADVLDYCRRSANPVGRLVLRVAGHDDPQLDAWSDAVCTALQLTNFWQDLARDWTNGRLYVPLDEVRRAGAREADLDAQRITPEWRAALGQAAARTRDLFMQGRPVCDAVPGRLRLELRFTWLGGMRILRQVEAAGFDVFRHRPALGAGDVPALAWRAARWPRSG